MGLMDALKVVVNPLKWRSGGDSVVVTYEQQSFEVEDTSHETLEDALAARPWAQEFDLNNPGERKKAAFIYQEESKGTTMFRVTKVAGGMQGQPGWHKSHGIPIFSQDTFPTAGDVWEAAEADYGGGIYNVKASTKAHLILKTYRFTGPARGPNERNEIAKTGKEAFREVAMGDALSVLKSDPVAYQEISMRILSKELGISVPSSRPTGTMDEQLIKEYLDANPQEAAMYVRGLLEAKNPKPVERTFAEQVREHKELVDLLKPDVEVAPGGGWREIVAEGFREAAKNSELSEIAKSVLGSALPSGVAPGTAPGAVPVTAVAQPPVVQRPQMAPPVAQGTPVQPPTTLPTTVEQPITSEVVPAQTPAATPEATPQVEPTPEVKGPSTAEWLVLLTQADPDTLLRGVKDDPREFMRACYLLVVEDEDRVAAQIIRLMRDNDPAVLANQVRTDLLTAIEGEWKALGMMMFTEEKYAKALDIVRTLASDEGAKWIKIAHATTLHLEREMYTEIEGRRKAKEEGEELIVGGGGRSGGEVAPVAQAADAETVSPNAEQLKVEAQVEYRDGLRPEEDNPLV